MSEADVSTHPEIHGFPVWIRISAIAVVVLLVISIVRVAGVFHDAIQVERAHKNLAQNNFAKAAEELKPVVGRYPDSIDFNLDLAEAEMGTQDYLGAAKILDRLGGREVSEEQNVRASAIGSQLDEVAKKFQGGQP